MFSTPSKTFLLGEYVCLSGPAVLINTHPRFILRKKEDAFISHQGERPAARFLRLHQLTGQGLSFEDPHQGRGGFGASSSETLMLAALFAKQQGQAFNLFETWQEYRDHSLWQGMRNSGCDLLSQATGHLAWVARGHGQVLRIDWPFPEYSLLLIATGNKVASHEHLANRPYIPMNDLLPLVYQGEYAIKTASIKSFQQALKHTQRILSAHRLSLPETQTLVEDIGRIPGVLAAKGCGALGADVLAVLCQRNSLPLVRSYLDQRALVLVADESQMCGGLLHDLA